MELSKILIVDDDPGKILSIQSILAKMDKRIRLVVCNSGNDALRHLLQENFVLILLDVNMPVMNGFETAALIRTRKKNHQIPIIFITAVNQTDIDVFQGYSVGAVDYIFTPIVPEILLAKVNVFVELYENKRELEEKTIKLEELNHELKRQVSLSDKLNQKLAEANDNLESFSFSVSHDLQAPLRHIMGYIELLTIRLGGSADDKINHYTALIVESAKNMSLLIEDLLTFSRSGRAELEKSEVDLNQLIDIVIEEMKGKNDMEGIKWKIDDMPTIYADKNLIKQVLVNYLSNAVKYTSKTQNPQIEIGHLTSGDEAVFYVNDNGIGFDEKFSDRLFVIFRRLQNAREYEGSGIGLSIVRQIVTRHGGRVWAKGTEGQGATFYFSLPEKKQN